MKAIAGLGKLIALCFWVAVLANLLHPFARPFATLLLAAGGLILLIHVVELLVLGSRLKGRPHPCGIASRCCCSAYSICSLCAGEQPCVSCSACSRCWRRCKLPSRRPFMWTPTPCCACR